MIKLISGACRVGKKLMRPTDKPFSLSEKEEAYLVAREAAVYVEEETPATDIATLQNAVFDGEPSMGVPAENLGENAQETSFDCEQLKSMTKDNLLKLANDLDLKVSERMTKDEIINTIMSVEVSTEDDESQQVVQPPIMSAAGPVE